MGNKLKNVLYLGESTAYGFMYAPNFSPAGFLQTLLKSNVDSEIEVQDLSKVSIRIKNLMERCKPIENYNPDAVIVFAGCNWRKDFWNMSEEDAEEIVRSVHSENEWYRVIRKKFIEMIEGKTKAFFKMLYEDYVSKNIPVIFVIPEFNLKEWYSNEYDTTRNWPSRSCEEWDKQVEHWKQSNSSEEILEAGRKISLEEPSNPLGYYIQAREYLKQGDYERADENFLKVLDTNIFRLGPPPATNTFIRDSVEKYGREYGIDVIDLHAKFRELYPNDISGDNLLVDYCHLNSTGIKLVCNMLADKLGEYFGFTIHNMLMDTVIDNSVEANAYFYASVHSAHMGNLNYDYLYRNCKRAIELDRSMLEKYTTYVKLATGKIPWRLNEGYTTIYSNLYPSIRKPKDCMVMDYEFVEVILDVLKEYGIELDKSIYEERLENHGVTENRKVNLLESYYRQSSYFHVFLDSKSIDYDNRNAAFAIFRTRVSQFYLISSPENNLMGRITYRSLLGLEDSKIQIYVNDALVLDELVDTQWRKLEFSIPQSCLKTSAVNIVKLVWPDLIKEEEELEKRIRETVISEYEYMVNRVRPRYGDLFQFEVCRKDEEEWTK